MLSVTFGRSDKRFVGDWGHWYKALPLFIRHYENLWVALGFQKLGDNIRDLFKVTLPISWRVVRWGEPRFEFIGVGCMICPWCRETDVRRKVGCSRQPVKANHFCEWAQICRVLKDSRSIDSCTSTDQTTSETIDVFAPPKWIWIRKHRFSKWHYFQIIAYCPRNLTE